MNDPLLAVSPKSPLGLLLDEHFTNNNLQQLLGAEVAKLDERLFGKAVYQPLSEFLERPGKEFRATLVATSYVLAGGQGRCPRTLQAIVEILHAGSLIIDDIQDQSNLRRGRPALHIEHGVPVALNAGSWMYFWAFSLVDKLELDEATQLGLYRWMSRSLVACHHGQGLDLTARMQDLPQEHVPAVVTASTQLKTGMLMELAAVLGAVAAGADEQALSRLARFGRRLGIALQMLDDVGGLVSEQRALKGHEDLILGRPTWPWAWLAEELSAAQYAAQRAIALEVERRDLHPEALRRGMRRALRGSGRVRVRRYLNDAFAELRAAVGPAEALGSIEREIARLEKSYG
jgi:geranylgeranyl pyrophosphate synthase